MKKTQGLRDDGWKHAYDNTLCLAIDYKANDSLLSTKRMDTQVMIIITIIFSFWINEKFPIYIFFMEVWYQATSELYYILIVRVAMMILKLAWQ